MSSIKTLYVGDDPSLQAELESTAQKHGLSIEVASTGKEGIIAFKPGSFDAILCDLTLRDIDGIEVLDKIRKIDSSIPFIVVTSHGSVKSAVKAIKQGADDFIEKPLDLNLLENIIRNLVDKHKLERGLKKSEENLSFLTENIPDIVYSLNPEGNFQNLNAAVKTVIGYEPEELLGKHVLSVIHPDDHARIIENMTNDIKNKHKGIRSAEFRMITKSGDIKHFETRRRLKFRNGEFLSHDGVVRDITEQKIHQDKLKKDSEDLEAMVNERTQSLEKAYQQLEALNKVSEWFSQIHDEELLFEEVPRLLTEILEFDRAMVFLEKKGRFELKSYRFVHDSPRNIEKNLSIINDPEVKAPKILKECYKKGQTCYISDVTSEEDWPRALLDSTSTKSILVSPIRYEGKPIGILVGSMVQQDRTISEQDKTRFEMFATMVGLSIDHIRAFHSLEEMVEDRTHSLVQAYEQLDSSKKILEAILNTSPNVILMVDKDGKILATNQAVVEMFGISQEDVLKLSFKKFRGLIEKKFENPSVVKKWIEKLYSSDQSHRKFDIRQLAKSSFRILKPVDRIIAIFTNQVLDDDGSEIGRVWSFIDITEVRQTTEMLSTLVDSSPIPSIVSRLEDGTVLFVNQPLADLVGYSREELIGVKTVDFYANPRDREEVLKQMHSEGRVTNIEIPIKRRDGEIFWMVFNLVTSDLGGEKVIIGAFYDISERKQAEDALKESEERFRQLTDTIDEAFWMTDPKKGEVIYVNPKFEDIYGKDYVSIYKDIDSWLKNVHPDDHAKMKKAAKKQLKHKVEEQYRVISEDGSERWLRETSYPIRNAEGEVYRVCGVTEDITDHKRAEEELQWEQNFVSTILDTAGALIVVLDREGNIVRFNRTCEEVSGYKFREVKGKPFWKLLIPEELKLVEERFSELAIEGIANEGENHWLTKSGDQRLISWSNTTLKDAEGKVEYIIATGLDITEVRKAEEQLRFYQLAFMSSTDGIGITDPEGNIIDYNQVYADNTKYKSDDSQKKMMHDAVREQGSFRGEMVRYDDKGEAKYFDLSVSPVNNDLDELIGYVGIGRDITQSKRDQEILARRLRYEEGVAGCSQALLEPGDKDEVINKALTHLLNASGAGRVYIFENFDDPEKGFCMRQTHEVCAPGVTVTLSDPDMQRIEIDEKFEKMYKTMSESQVYGGPVKSLDKDTQEYLADQDVLSVIGIPLLIDDKWFGFMGFDDVEQEREWSEEETRLLKTAAEMISGYISRKKASEALLISEKRFRSLVENVNDVIYSLDADGNITYISPQFENYSGFKVEEVIGKPSVFLLHDEFAPIHEQWLEDGAPKEEKQTDFEFQFKTKAGNYRWIVSNSSVLKNDDDTIREIIGVAHDITDLRNALNELEEANLHLRETQGQLVQSEKMASLGMLVAGIAHEINTPIGAVASMHDTLVRAMEQLQDSLLKECREDSPRYGHISKMLKVIGDANNVIKNGTARVTNIVRRLRSFARLDEAELKDANLHEGIEDTLTLIHHEIKHKITMNRDFGKLPEISCFPGKLNQVFLNILVNSSQAIKEKGEISIKTWHKNKKVFLEFTDNGIGIPKDHLHRVFDPGFTTKGVGVGTGLGLSICYQIIEDHHGEIKVDSEVGKGTTFTISIPTNLEQILEHS